MYSSDSVSSNRLTSNFELKIVTSSEAKGSGHELGSTEPMKTHKKTKTIFENTKGKHKEAEVERADARDLRNKEL
jgi:hypothetical protein